MKPNEIRKMVIPAAGLGTRMIGAIPGIPGNFPKEMLPLGNKGAIQYAVAEGYHAGIREFAIVIRPGKEVIRRLFEEAQYPGGLPEPAQQELETLCSESTFHFLTQEDLRGECNAILQAREVLAGEPFVVNYPDNVALPHPGVIHELCTAFEESPAHLVALMEITEENYQCINDSGRVDLKGTGPRYRISNFLPKGAGCFVSRFPGELRTCGIYIAQPEYIDYIEKALAGRDVREEVSDGMVRRMMLEDGVQLEGIRVSGEVHDAGNPEGFWRAAGECGRLLQQ